MSRSTFRWIRREPEPGQGIGLADYGHCSGITRRVIVGAWPGVDMPTALTLRQNRSDCPLLPAIRDQRLQIRPHLIGNHLMSFGSGMDSIGLIQIRISGYIPQ